MTKNTPRKPQRATGNGGNGNRSSTESQDDPHRLARRYLGLKRSDSVAAPTLRYWRGDWWRWNGRYFQPVPETDIRAEVTGSIKDAFDSLSVTVDKPARKVKRGIVSDVLQAVEGLTLLPAGMDAPAWVDMRPFAYQLSMLNGLLDFDRVLNDQSDPLSPHSPEWFSVNGLDYGYDPEADCPKWKVFLDEVLEADRERIALLQEFFGYCLTHDTSQHRFMLAVGEGANGKSVMMHTLEALLGFANVSHVPLELFGERFHLTTTLGKLANLVSEIGDVKQLAEGILKAFVAGDRMFFDRKGRQGVNAKPTARLIFAANDLPRFRDRSEGVWRRMLLMPFRYSIPEDRQDRYLTNTLRAELPGIFNWALAGLKRLREQGCFTEPAVCREQLAAYRCELNSARWFLQTHICPSAEGVIESDELFQAYLVATEREGLRALGRRELGKEVAKLFRNASRKRLSGNGSDRPYAYAGLGWRASDD